nr:MAG TPA: hypothetical protein [Caudoviricetes sp.]
MITKNFIIVTANPTNCFKIKIPIKFCMVISGCVSNIFSEKPLTILLLKNPC